MTDIIVPDIGDFTDVEVIEVLVAEGQEVAAEEGIITLETDKATMDIPAPAAGTIAKLSVKVGDKVNQGDVIGALQAGASTPASDTKPEPASTPQAEESKTEEPSTQEAPPPSQPASTTQPVTVPDIGDFKDVEVIEVLVAEGQEVAAEEGIITLETDKATMDIPAPAAGKIEQLAIKVGDKVNQGDVIAQLLTSGTASTPVPTPAPTQAATQPAPPSTPAPAQPTPVIPPVQQSKSGTIYASPAVRKIGREFGVDLSQVTGTGNKGRILKEDVQAYVRQRLSHGGGATAGTGMNMSWQYALPPQEDEDFSKYGPVEEQSLARIRQLSGPALHRNWLTVPHVTQFDDADVTDMEKFRQEHSAEAKAQGFSLSPLAFLVKAICKTLQKYPEFNSSLALDGKSLIIKKYYNIGIAVDTPNGLMVPVLTNIENKSVMQIAQAMAELSKKTREGKVSGKELRGGSFTISSLGGIGGTHFTPIVNVPEVAILGVGKSRQRPVWDGNAFVPRLMMPLALSYDHRVIDGAKGARFITELSMLLSDIRNIVL